MKRSLWWFAFLLGMSLNATEFNSAMQNYINAIKAEAKAQNPNFKDFDSKRGQAIFAQKNKGKNGEMISFQSCHNVNLTQNATNVFTGKAIAPLAPSVNPTRLTDVKEVKKWLKRNFKDVYLREGTALEKGDVLYYIITQ